MGRNMAKDKALGSNQDDDEVFNAAIGGDEETNPDSGPAVENEDSGDDHAAVSAAIAEQHRGNRPDLKEISAAIKGARLGNQPLRAEAQPTADEPPPAAKSPDSVPLATFLE